VVISNNDVDRLSLGTYFAFDSLLDLSNSHYDVIIKIDKLEKPSVIPYPVPCNWTLSINMTSPLDRLSFQPSFQKYLQQKDIICKQFEEVRESYMSLMQYILSWLEQIDNAIHLLAPTNSRTRDPRFLSQIGKIFRVFGLVHESDISNLKASVDHSLQLGQINSQNVHHLHTRLTSVVNLVGEKINQLHEVTEINAQIVKIIRDHLQKYNNQLTLLYLHRYTTEALQNIVNKLLTDSLLAGTLQLQTLTLTLQLYQQRFRDILLLKSNRLSPTLLGTHQIQTALETVTKQLRYKFPNYHISSLANSPEYFYYVPQTVGFTYNDSIYVNLQVPITRDAGVYKLYKVNAFELPVATNTSVAGHFQTMSINKLPEYYAIREDGEKYLTLEAKHLQDCHGEYIKLCKSTKVEYAVQEYSCVHSLFHGMIAKVKLHCPLVYIDRKVPPLPEVIEIRERSYILLNFPKATWFIDCATGKAPKTLESCSFCHLKLDCGCSLVSNSVTINPSITNCDAELLISDNITPSAQINLLQILYQINSTIRKYDQTMYMDMSNISIPPITIPPLLAFDNKQASYERKFDYKDILKWQASTSQPIYSNPVRYWMDKHKNVQPALKWIAPTVITSSLTTLAIIMMIIVIVIKVRGTKALLAALPIPSFSEARPIITDTSVVIPVHYLEPILITLLVLVSLVILFLLSHRLHTIVTLFKHSKTSIANFVYFLTNSIPKHKAALKLELISEQYEVDLPLATLPIPITDLKVQISDVPPTFKLVNNCNAHLIISWENVHVNVINAVHEEFSLQLSNIIPISIFKRSLVRQILLSPQFTVCFIVCKQASFQRIIVGTICNKNPPAWIDI
jgi:hypothetical protein